MRQRWRWLRRRALRGLRRPDPLRVVTVNGMAASQVSPDRTARIVRKAAGEADVLACCEVFNVDVADVLGDKWDVAQRGRKGTSAATTAVAVRRSRGRIMNASPLTRPVGPTLGKRRAINLRSRSWLPTQIQIDPGTQYTWRHRFSAGHAPPKRAWFLWAAYAATTPRGTASADWNKDRAQVARWFRRRVRMIRLLGTIHPRWIPSTEARGIDVGGDHKAAATILWPKEKR